MKYLLGIDFGTGGSKACLTDAELNPVAYSFREYPIFTCEADYSEHDPQDYWRTVCENIRECLKKAQADPRDVAAVAVSSAMPSLVMTDAKGAPVGRAINLMDKRAKREVALLLERVGEEAYARITDNRLEDHPAIVNLMWMRRNRPEDYARITRIHSIDGYIAWRMCGVHNVNASNAVFFGAYNIKEARFDEALLKRLDLDPEIFPPVRGCSEILGGITPQAAGQTGLALDTPVLSGQTDCNAGWLGGGALHPGDIQMNLGTCGNFGVIMEKPEFLHSMINFPYTIPGTYISVPTTTTGGVLMRYMRDNFAQAELATAALTGADVYDLLNAEAARVSPGSDGLVVLPYLMGERTPIWDANAKGTVFGLSLRHTKGHLIRAMMESVAYALYDSFRTLQPSLSRVNYPIVLNEGGAKSVLWRRIITDVFNLPTVLVQNRVGAPYGDCVLAGVGVGILPDFHCVAEKVKYVDRMDPDPKNHAVYMDYFGIYEQLYPCLKAQFAALDGVQKKHARRDGAQ